MWVYLWKEVYHGVDIDIVHFKEDVVRYSIYHKLVLVTYAELGGPRSQRCNPTYNL